MQRKRIYEQRDRVFTKEDLSEDVDEMLRLELHKRVEAVAGDEEGTSKLLAYLDEIQPPMETETTIYPSFTLHLLIDDIKNDLGQDTIGGTELRRSLLKLAEKSLEAERRHLMNSAETLLDRTEESIDQARQDRFEILDNFFQGLSDRVEESGGSLRAQELLDELSSLVRIPLRLSTEDMRRLASGDDSVADVLHDQVDSIIVQVNLARVIGTLQRRVEDLDLRPGQFQDMEWREISNEILNRLDDNLAHRTEALSAPGGVIDRDLETAFEKVGDGTINLEQNTRALIGLLITMAQGTKISFDRRTHRRGQQKVTRLTYFFYAARLIGDREPEELEEYVSEHLIGAQEAQRALWGRYEFSRLAQTEVSMVQLDQRVQQGLSETLGADRFNEAASLPMNTLPPEEAEKVIEVLGKRLQNEIYREVLLGTISNLWVEYLTRVDALRVSIGLEAYAQRDPLVQYKGKASEMFQSLLAEIRGGVVSRMLTYQPSRRSTAAVDREQSESVPEGAESAGTPQASAENRTDRKKKRRRH